MTPTLPGGFAQDFGQLTLEGDFLYWDGEDDEEWVHLTLAGRTPTLFWPEVVLDRNYPHSEVIAWPGSSQSA